MKSVTTVDEYKWTLSDDLRKMAELELRETDEIREHALTSIREWAIKNPRLANVRLDSKFILRFLRFKKFSIPQATEALERYLVLREYSLEGKKVYQNFDYKDPSLTKLLDAGVIFPLPERDSEGRRVIFYRPKAFDVYKDNRDDIIRMGGIIFESILENEEDQIRGVVHIADGSGLGFSYLTLYTPQEGFKICKNTEKLLPLRHKQIHGTLVHSSIKYAIDWMMNRLSNKLKERVHLYSKFEEIKAIDQKLLPLEYGGVMPMKEMIEIFKDELKARRDMLLRHDKMSVRFELYPEPVRRGSISAHNTPLDSPVDAFNEKKEMFGMSGAQGSFRKLEFD